jgi:DNA adenine methylase
MTLIRYPGSKAKLARQIVAAFPDEMRLQLWAHSSDWEYREPFFGAGAVGFRVLEAISFRSRVVLNDKDLWLVYLWNSVLKRPDELIERIECFKPSPDYFYEFKEQDGDKSIDPVEAGFRKLALHQMSVSGFGYKSGGPIGGKNQANAKYKIDCRWNSQRLCRSVLECHKKMRRFRRLDIMCGDFEQALKGIGQKCFVYLDPPYVAKGGMLYRCSMDEQEHRRLAVIVKSLSCAWALSYDDHPLIRSLYSWAEIYELKVTYSNATLRGETRRPKNREILICPAKIAA